LVSKGCYFEYTVRYSTMNCW